MVLIFCSTPPHWGPDVCVTMSIIYPCIQYSQTFFCFFCALFLIHEKALKPLFFNENRAWFHAPSQVYAYYIVIFFTKFFNVFFVRHCTFRCYHSLVPSLVTPDAIFCSFAVNNSSRLKTMLTDHQRVIAHIWFRQLQRIYPCQYSRHQPK